MRRFERDSRRRAWPHIRAVLIALHISAVLALCLPHPGIVADRSRFESARGKHELASWGKTLRAVGWEISDAELEERAWQWALSYKRWHRQWINPFWHYTSFLHQRQSWSMFTHPKRRVGKVWVEIDEGNGFQPIFVSKSDRYDAYEDILTHNRMRKLFNRVTSHRYREGFDEFSEWIAARVARDYPSAASVRVRIENLNTPTASEVRSGTVPTSEFTRLRVIELERGR